MDERISKFTIGLVLVSCFVAIFSLFMSGLSDSYDVEYDNSTIEVYNKLDELTEHTEAMQQDMNEIKEDSSALDIIGDIFSGGYTVLLTTQSSFDVFVSMIGSVFSNINLGPAGSIFMGTFIVIVLLLIGFILLSAIMKWNV